MTSLLLKDNYILYSENNQIKTTKLKSTIPFDFDLFYSETDYKTFVENIIKSTASLPTFENLIINNDYYNHFGLIELLEKNESIKQNTFSEFDVEINISNSKYKVVDVTQTSINIYSIQNDIIVEQDKIDISKILEPLFDSLKEVCTTNDINEFKNVLFDYEINCDTYNWLKADGYSIDDLEDVIIEKGFKQLFPNIDLKNFFELIHNSILDFIKTNFKNDFIIFKSPFTNYSFLNTINTNKNISYSDEFSLLVSPITIVESQKNSNQKPEIELSLNNKSKTWILIDLSKDDIFIKNYKTVSLKPISKEIKNTVFNIDKNRFVKLFLETKTNFLNKSCLSIDTLDNQYFYKNI